MWDVRARSPKWGIFWQAQARPCSTLKLELGSRSKIWARTTSCWLIVKDWLFTENPFDLGRRHVWMRTSGRGQRISGPSGTRQGRDQRNDLQHSRGVGQPDLWLVQRLPDGQIRAPEKTVLFSARTVHHGPVVQPLEVRGPPVASRTAKFLVFSRPLGMPSLYLLCYRV